MRGQLSISLVICLVALGVAATVRSATAKTIDVPAGTGTLQAAIDAASPGDHLRLEGIYKGAVVVNKSLKISCKKNRVVLDCTIDADCAAPVALEIAADNVSIGTKNNWMTVYRATSTNVLVSNRNKVKLNAILNRSPLAGGPPNHCAATWETSVEIDASVEVKAKQLDGGSLYIHDVPLDGHVLIQGGQFSTSSTAYSEAAIVIEDSGIGATVLGKGGIRLRKNIATAYTDHVSPSEMGISLVNSYGVDSKVLTLGDREIGEGLGGGAIGISLDASSDNNLFQNQYVMALLEAGDPAYVDNGTGNCLKKFDKGNFAGPTVPDSCP